jgi:ribonucleoside-diphosphate reductase alpha chain
LNKYKFENKLQEEIFKTKRQYNKESVEEYWMRIASNIAKTETKKELQKYWTQQYYSILENYKVTTGGRIGANIGTGLKGTTLRNCYINSPIRSATIKHNKYTKDNKKITFTTVTPKSSDNLFNIMLTILEQAKTLSSEGGYGINLGFIRPRGSIIKGQGIGHPGVCAYIDLIDRVSDIIVRGDNDGYKDTLKNFISKEELSHLNNAYKKEPRKGALMLCYPISGPDVEEVIKLKRQSGRCTKANISIIVTNAFMKAVDNDEMWELKFKGKVFKRVKAKDLYNLIMESTWKYNDPGIIFVDTMNYRHPLTYITTYNAANPCSEVAGSSDLATVCLLGSINLTKFVTEQRTFKWKEYRQTVAIFARMLDSVNDIPDYVLPVYEYVIKNLRQYGMGINGLGSTLAMLGMQYDSEKAVEFCKKVNKIKFVESWKTSALLAKEKGPFPLFDLEKYKTTAFYTEVLSHYPEIKHLINKHGVRNGTCTTQPPLGNSSIEVGCVSNGIEPIFMKEYERTYITHEWPKGMNKDNIKSLLKEEKQGKDIIWKGKYKGQSYVYEPHNRGLCKIEIVKDYGVKWLEDRGFSTKGLKLAYDLSVSSHLEMLAATQENLEQSCSKTVNLPAHYTLSNIKDLYFKAWKMGIIGVTTYRDGTMASVLKAIEEKPSSVFRKNVKLPKTFINGPTQAIKVEGTKFYIHFSYLPEDKEFSFPIAIWIKTNTSYRNNALARKVCISLENLARSMNIPNRYINSTLDKSLDQPVVDKISRMIALNLRHNVPIGYIVDHLTNIEGAHIGSLIFAVKKFLKSHIKNGEKSSRTCSECNNTNMYFEAGCVTCPDCGFSGCD